MTTTLIVIFLIGILFIALEDKLGINKAAITMLMASASWLAVSLFGEVGHIEDIFIEYLGKTSETLFFVLGTLTLIEVVDSNGGFKIIKDSISTRSKRKLLWIVCMITFVLASLLDDIAAAVIIVSMLRKIIVKREQRVVFSCMVILSANAGGAFSPIGDVTTMILWMGGNIEAMHQIKTLFLPSVVCMIVPLLVMTFRFKKGEQIESAVSRQRDNSTADSSSVTKVLQLSKNSAIIIFIIAMLTMISVPFYQVETHLPPYVRVMSGLSIIWIYADLVYRRKKIMADQQLGVSQALKKVDVTTILFFLGILMTIGAMDVTGMLKGLGVELEKMINEPLGISLAIGVMSSFIENVALVSATQGMYPIAETGVYMANSDFWTLLAYCSVTGGSLLLIGSATGVTIMSIEKIGFIYYLRKFSLLALMGYIAGALVFIFTI